MRYYAEIVDGKVNQVIVINSEWDQEKVDSFLVGLSGNEWVETSMDGSVGNKYAGRGDEYHSDLKAFVSKKPFDSWKLDPILKIYLPDLPRPIAVPIGYVWEWSEKVKRWILRELD